MASNVVTREHLELLGLPATGVQYVLDVCSSPPDRKVGRRRRRNLILEVPMRNLSAVLQAESLSGEFPFLLELDRRGDVTAAFDQPISVRLEITDRAGRRTRTSYTADYLVVYTDI
jgi:putative transposase